MTADVAPKAPPKASPREPVLVELPHNDDAETSVLGAVLVDNAHLRTVADLLRPEDFYRSAHQRLWRSMLAMAEDDEPIDVLTLAERHQGDGTIEAAGGILWLSQLMDGIPRLVNVAHYAGIVRERSRRRSLLRLLGDTRDAVMLGDGSADDIVAQLSERVRTMQTAGTASEFHALTDVLVAVLDATEARQAQHEEHGPGLAGLATGLDDFDELTDGLSPGQLVILAATSGMGKTAAMMGMAQHAASLGRHVAVFSLEMSDVELGRRIVSSASGVDGQKLRRALLTDDDWRRIELAARRLRSSRLWIYGSAEASVPQMLARCRELQAAHGLDLVVVDYLQLVTPSGGRRDQNREQEVNAIARGLKMLARELGVPALVASQLSADADKREGAPQLGDLRESKAIVHHADIVAFLYRRWLQLRRLGKSPEDTTKDDALLIVAKHRNGPEGAIHLRWRGETATYRNAARPAQELDRHGRPFDYGAPPPIDTKSLAAGERDDVPEDWRGL